MYDLLLRRGQLLDDRPPQDIGIRDGLITEVAPDINDRSAVLIELDGRLLLSGLVNPHTHLDKAFTAGRVKNSSGTIDEARSAMKDAKASFTYGDVQERASRAVRQSVRNGVTAIRTHVDVDPIVGLTGVEAVVAVRDEFKDSVDIQVVAFPQEGITETPGTLELLEEALKMGADIIGGHPSIAANRAALVEQIDIVFSLAKSFDVDIDVHIDYSIDRDYSRTKIRYGDGREYPDELGIVYLAQKTISEGYHGRVSASHVCGLDMVRPRLRRNVIDLLKEAEVSVIGLPSSNMYAHGRSDPIGRRRGIVPIRELHEAGISVAIGTDNIRDPFNPFVNTDLIQHASIAAIACHMVTEDEFRTMLSLHGDVAARIIGLGDAALKRGNEATLLAMEAKTLAEVLDGVTNRALVVKGGQVVACSQALGYWGASS